MTHREKVKHFVAEMKKKGVPAFTAAPPFWRLIWLLGFKNPPPYYESFGTLAAMSGAFFGFCVAAAMLLVGQLPALKAIGISALAGCAFGVLWTWHFRMRMNKISMPDWSNYPARRHDAAG